MGYNFLEKRCAVLVDKLWKEQDLPRRSMSRQRIGNTDIAIWYQIMAKYRRIKLLQIYEHQNRSRYWIWTAYFGFLNLLTSLTEFTSDEPAYRCNRPSFLGRRAACCTRYRSDCFCRGSTRYSLVCVIRAALMLARIFCLKKIDMLLFSMHILIFRLSLSGGLLLSIEY